MWIRIRTLFPFSPYRITRTNQYTTTLSTLAMGNHLLFEIEDFKITNVTVLFFKKLFLMKRLLP